MKFIYAIGSDPAGPIKIGIAADPDKRRRQLQTGHAAPLKLFHAVEVKRSDVHLIERLVHRTLNHQRAKGEWFAIDAETARAEIEFAVIRYAEEPSLRHFLG